MSVVRYFDSSAIVKLVVEEPESDALRAYARTGTTTVTSVVGVVEARRAAARRGGMDPREMALALGGFDVVGLDQQVADAATGIPPATLRALDAIHLATAGQFGADLQAIVTYDARMIEAARALGLPVVSPGRESAA
jgi:predicted nucleic acid-binding protein